MIEKKGKKEEGGMANYLMGKGTCSQQPEFDPQDPYGRERCDSYKLSTDCYVHVIAYAHTHICICTHTRVHTHNTKKN